MQFKEVFAISAVAAVALAANSNNSMYFWIDLMVLLKWEFLPQAGQNNLVDHSKIRLSFIKYCKCNRGSCPTCHHSDNSCLVRARVPDLEKKAQIYTPETLQPKSSRIFTRGILLIEIITKVVVKKGEFKLSRTRVTGTSGFRLFLERKKIRVNITIFRTQVLLTADYPPFLMFQWPWKVYERLEFERDLKVWQVCVLRLNFKNFFDFIFWRKAVVWVKKKKIIP